MDRDTLSELQGAAEALFEQLGGKVTVETPFETVQAPLFKLLGGKFDPELPAHAEIYAGLGAWLGQQLVSGHGGFWFQQREYSEGLGVGFERTVFPVAPFEWAEEALDEGSLAGLTERLGELRKFLAEAPEPLGLTAEDYESMLDPALLQISSFDIKVMERALATPLSMHRAALTAATTAVAGLLTEEGRDGLAGLVEEGLAELDPSMSLSDAFEDEPRMAETLLRILAADVVTSAAFEDLWGDLVFPLVLQLAPGPSAPEDAGFVNFVKSHAREPYGTDALLGVLDPDALEPVGGENLEARLFTTAYTAPAGFRFDARALQAELETAGVLPPPGAIEEDMPEDAEIAQVCLALGGQLKNVLAQVDGKTHVLTLHRMTEGEAAAETALRLLSAKYRTELEKQVN